jgi:glycosyltransferase involved in cell wall biosynthesis
VKVAILNRAPGDPIGGDRLGVHFTIEALLRAGVGAEHLWGPGLDRLKEFDLAHIYHVNFHFCRQNFRVVRWAKIPYVVTPIFYPEFEEMSHAEQLAALWGAETVLPFSGREGEEIRERFNVAYTPIPNGTGPEFHAEPSADRVGVCASDWGGTKNTDVIAAACAELGIPFTRFQNVPFSRLPEEYRKFRLFVTATRSDRMSLAVGEALCSGCRVLASTANRGNEWYPGLETIAPDAPQAEWTARIRDAYTAIEWDWPPNLAARELTWDSVAALLKRQYEKAFN